MISLNDLEKILQQYWGFSSFRPLQKEIITAVLEGKDTVALLPTGGGKSICYQLPALINEGCCIVISPLIALMQDQVNRMQSLNISAACIHAGMRFHEVKRHLENAREGAYKLLYVSPERLQSSLFNEYVSDMPINLFAVDEAHCISQWGHDFRPDYLKIASLKNVFAHVPFLALTATATQEVQNDIIHQLQLAKPVIFQQSFKRTNIFYEIKHSDNKIQDTINTVSSKMSSIIYCRSRKQTELVAQNLSHKNLNAVYYHAGMDKKRREETQEKWMKNEAETMVATTAFGMGIDKPDVRRIVHYDTPEHLEAYYQEAGRAGRDHQPANALLLWDKKDIDRLKESTSIKFPDEIFLRKTYQAVCDYLQIASGTEPNDYFDFDPVDFCAKFSLSVLPALSALKLLEQEGLWTLSDAFYKPPTVQFISERNVLDDIAQTNSTLGLVCVNMLRMYSSIFHFPVAIRVLDIAKRCKMSVKETELALQHLHQMNILDYHPATDRPLLYFHHYRVDSQHLYINLQRIHQLREAHRRRTETMIAFLQNETICRERFLLSYFDENTTDNCGHCDVCAKKQSTPIPEHELRKILLLHFSKKEDSLASILNEFPHHLKDEIIHTLRLLLDEEKIVRNGNLYKIK